MKLFTTGMAERAQAELDTLGPQGWEVSVVQSTAADTLRLFLKHAA